MTRVIPVSFTITMSHPCAPTSDPTMADVPNATRYFHETKDPNNIRGAICNACGKCVVRTSRNMYWHFIMCKKVDPKDRANMIPVTTSTETRVTLPQGRRLKACPDSKGRAVRSKVWTRFVFSNSQSKCIYCGKLYSSSSGVSTLKQHIILCFKTPMNVKFYIAGLIPNDPSGEVPVKTE